MAKWKNEDDIRAELRFLTDELKHLREELGSMVSPSKPNPTRAFLHQPRWTPDPHPPPDRPDTAGDSRKPRATKPRRRTK